MNCRSQFFVLFWIFGGGFCNVVKRSPSCVDSVCEFDWVVDYKFTMMWYNKTSDTGPQYQPIGLGDDGLIRRRSTTPNCIGTINRVTLTGSSYIVQLIFNYNASVSPSASMTMHLSLSLYLCFSLSIYNLSLSLSLVTFKQYTLKSCIFLGC